MFLQKSKKQKKDKYSPIDFFYAPGKVTFQNYKIISQQHEDTLKKARDITNKKEIFSAAYCACALKYDFDEKYGKDGYRIISLGTSPAVVCEAMSAMGCDVVFMPASNVYCAKSGSDSNKLKSWEKKCMKQSLDYVKSKGVKKSFSSNKKNILIDLIVSGRSISTAANLIIKNSGLKKEDLVICSIKHELKTLEETLGINPRYIRAHMRNINSSAVEEMCNVPHFNANSSISASNHSIFEYFDKFSKPYARAVSLCILDEINKNNIALENFANKKGNFSINDYIRLRANYQIALVGARNTVRKHKCINPLYTAKAANAIKAYFDKQYGENSYRIISLGTSPAFICETIQKMGSDVLFMPISGLHKNRKIDPNDKNINIYIALRYLKNRLDEAKDSGKKNIVIDYVCTGSSLDSAVNLIINKIGIEEDGIVKCSLLDLLYKLSLDDEYDLNCDDAKNIEMAIASSEVDDICCVPHFEAYWHEGFSDEEVFDKFDNYSSSLARLYQLCVCDEITKIKYAQKKSE